MKQRTGGLKAFLRKKALQDSQEIASKLYPKRMIKVNYDINMRNFFFSIPWASPSQTTHVNSNLKRLLDSFLLILCVDLIRFRSLSTKFVLVASIVMNLYTI